jgi:hypothetical protein
MCVSVVVCNYCLVAHGLFPNVKDSIWTSQLWNLAISWGPSQHSFDYIQFGEEAMGDLLYSRTKCVCVLVLLTLWGPKIPKSPHKDSKTREILPRGDISHVPTRTEAIVSLGVRFRVRVRSYVYGLG